MCYLVHLLPGSSDFFSLTNFCIFHSTETNLKIISGIPRIIHRRCFYSTVTLLVASFCCCHCPNGNIWNIMWPLTHCYKWRSNVGKCPNVGFTWPRTEVGDDQFYFSLGSDVEFKKDLKCCTRGYKAFERGTSYRGLVQKLNVNEDTSLWKCGAVQRFGRDVKRQDQNWDFEWTMLKITILPEKITNKCGETGNPKFANSGVPFLSSPGPGGSVQLYRDCLVLPPGGLHKHIQGGPYLPQTHIKGDNPKTTHIWGTKKTKKGLHKHMTQLQKHKQKSSKIRFAGLKCLVCLVLRSLVQLEHLAVLIKTASEMHVALWIFSSTFIHFIHFYPFSSTFFHINLCSSILSTFIHVHPYSTLIRFHPFSSTFIQIHPPSCSFTHLYPFYPH